MTVTEDEGRADRHALAYDPGDRVGLCLDVDGTVYRSGSVFVEALAFLPYVDGLSLTRADRRRRRAALRAVAGYRGGLPARIKWWSLLSGLDALDAVGGDRLAEAVLAALVERQRGRTGGPPLTDSDGYAEMRRAVLSAYGDLLRGKCRTDVARAIAEAVDRRCPVDADFRAALARLTRGGDVDLRLITDAPEHVATAYARKLSGGARVTGTRYETDSDGRYTGAFERVDKGDALERLRDERGWDYVVAAGDAPADAAMVRGANLFLAVDGQGALPGRFDGADAASVREPDATLRARFASGTNVVRVPREVSLARALGSLLQSVGVASG